MGWAEKRKGAIRAATRPTASRSRRCHGSNWDFIGEDTAWFCLGCGDRAAVIPIEGGLSIKCVRCSNIGELKGVS
jgi:hypothetical protein